MRQLIKTENAYQLVVDGTIVFVQTQDWRNGHLHDFTAETLQECFLLHCAEFGLSEDGTEPAGV